ncbi:regulator of protease activity HflC (stomatin/prohibitin superfamily) [Thermocatellispora tengchongensis]|uniref:Regulator of protease activity HflC (Stomatin/prohibitin superfamily) n=1 Tax=Thermocatellispora tengchongensis TaxID=1073253 RepID=A0A840PFW3_9ACTN|nr:SPFH domain-containing protein [Thermocatellispora tengchongensis]MBB5137676.1 regulator of protease activity HflC (stomatin/prohibitin superfamily) [Thermocatellispora tengchongensis]
MAWEQVLAAVVVVAFLGFTVARTIRVVPPATAGVVERLGRYHRTLNPGVNVVVPFIDRIRDLTDLREQVVSFPPQPVSTADNLVVSIDTVVHYRITDPKAAMYEVAGVLSAVEQLITTTLRGVVGRMELERALTSRDEIKEELRLGLATATERWGVAIERIELKSIEPPASIQESMERRMRAERDKQAAVLEAQGRREAAILSAEGEKQAALLRAGGEAEAVVLKAQADAEAHAMRAKGQADAIAMVFQAIHEGRPDERLLAYQYLQTLPEIAKGDANKVWIVPSEMGKVLEGLNLFARPQEPRTGTDT